MDEDTEDVVVVNHGTVEEDEVVIVEAEEILDVTAIGQAMRRMEGELLTL